MERQGLTIVRTGIWTNRTRYLDWVSGSVDERLLSAIEAYLYAAARHHMQVVFTFFAFEPQTEMQLGSGQDVQRLGAGSNPYLDPVAIEAQVNFVRSIASRFRDVPFLSFDLINEPSFSNPKRLWKGNSPNGDPVELSAWQQWLEKRYRNIDKLAQAWRTPPTELGSFDKVPLPSIRRFGIFTLRQSAYRARGRLQFICTGCFSPMGRYFDSNHSRHGALQANHSWSRRGWCSGSCLNQFWANTQINYTVNHSWWRDDALLWNSVVAKTPNKPNIIGETGPQPVWSVDGSWLDPFVSFCHLFLEIVNCRSTRYDVHSLRNRLYSHSLLLMLQQYCRSGQCAANAIYFRRLCRIPIYRSYSHLLFAAAITR